MVTCRELLSRRQALRDQVWLSGPEHFDMADWGLKGNDSVTLYELTLPDSTFDINACGTTCCLAGHAALITGISSTEDISNYFGLADSNDLFHSNSWCGIPFSGTATSLWDIRYSYMEQGYSKEHAEWLTVIDYLNDLIKNQVCND